MRARGIRWPMGEGWRAPHGETLRTFPIRTCSDNKFRGHQRQGRPCLLFHIEKCSGPCIGAVEPATYRQMLADLMAFLSGDTHKLSD